MNMSKSNHPLNEDPPEEETSGDRLRQLYYDRVTDVKVWDPITWTFLLVLPLSSWLAWQLTLNFIDSEHVLSVFRGTGSGSVVGFFSCACMAFASFRAGLVYADHANSSWEKQYRSMSYAGYATGLIAVLVGMFFLARWMTW